MIDSEGVPSADWLEGFTVSEEAEMDWRRRVARVEARQEIGQLPIRYALAVDQRDLEAWSNTFVPDVDMGRHGAGREALRAWIAPQVARFYRSIHLICGHRIDLPAEHGPDGPERATGSVYCRAEHEAGGKWVVMAIRYDDVYRRIGSDWFFERRTEKHWYSGDVLERPVGVEVDVAPMISHPPTLPEATAVWRDYWAGRDLAEITNHP